jgi:hypothetical protein
MRTSNGPISILQVDPEPQVCHGRSELKAALKRQAAQDIRLELEEPVGRGDRALVVVRQPMVDANRARKADDRNYIVVTVRGGRIVALHS